MGTSVEMDEETSSRLEELQAQIKLETGRKVSQQELLRRLVDDPPPEGVSVLDVEGVPNPRGNRGVVARNLPLPHVVSIAHERRYGVIPEKR